MKTRLLMIIGAVIIVTGFFLILEENKETDDVTIQNLVRLLQEEEISEFNKLKGQQYGVIKFYNVQNLSGLDLGNIDLSQTVFDYVNFSNSNMTGAIERNEDDWHVC